MLKGFPQRKDKIVLAALEIVNEFGMQGLTTKSLAKRQNMSESLLYKHFASLDDVLIAVVEYFARFDLMIINSLHNKGWSARDKIIEYIRSFVELYENYPPLVAIILNYETLMNYEHTRDKAIMLIEGRTTFIRSIVTEGQKDKTISNYYEPQELTDIIAGSVRAIIQRWKMVQYTFPLKKEIIITLEKILQRS